MRTRGLNINKAQPRYLFLVDLFINNIRDGEWKQGDMLPSLSNVCKEFSVSRDTALATYRELKVAGVVTSVAGKGYFLTGNVANLKRSVFLLFDEFNSFKEDLYNSFLKTVGNHTRVDIYFHYFNFKVFNQLISSNAGKYSHYVIMPAQFKNVSDVLQILPKQRTYILDQIPEELKGKYSSVCQNFEKDIYEALIKGNFLLKKYDKLLMLYPGGKEPEGQKIGFIKYCEDFNWNYSVLEKYKKIPLKKGEVYITPDNRILVELIKKAKQLNLNIGKDIGIVSYNDTVLKEVVLDGITTISTDFVEMGKTLAKLLDNKEIETIYNASSLIIRKSL